MKKNWRGVSDKLAKDMDGDQHIIRFTDEDKEIEDKSTY